MEVKELQSKINETIELIDEKTGVEHNVNNTFLHLIEELGEVANQLNKPNIRNEKIRKEDLSDELGDVLLLITRIAHLHDVDIEEAVEEKIKKLKERHNL